MDLITLLLNLTMGGGYIFYIGKGSPGIVKQIVLLTNLLVNRLKT